MDDDAMAVLRRDPVMARLIEKHDPYTEPEWNEEFERLVVSVINQSISTAAANAVRERVYALFDGPITPDAILTADDEALADAGLGEQKAEYVNNAAEAFLDRDLTREGLADHTDEEVIEELTRIRGIGEWTARMYLLFVLDREDVLPLGDLAVRRGIEQLYNDGETLTRTEMREIADAWRPYRSAGTKYVWASYESD
ncbi:3-methyl-adenine DNA glycosylase II [Halalkalicoccus paucihalophilus]|uniref:3-methyl-adenine DNA glycosylase II n=1 Tax=Halalkalicoccus paucihalophilus TaxID=1008153 RepID=A0A151AGP9_9EURY|nr:DNA-3-methyladenine glycosylase [Halalkalicoccus paucihalophilus]KYH26712.1 3-methyl-adenine DNA glycosylase II [Halalkalicoccus paucihalophilus]